MSVILFRLVCQGCNRYSRAAHSLAGAINLAVQDGWETGDDGGRPSSTGFCRRCSASIVASTGTNP